LLSQNEAIVVFPEGNRGSLKSYRQRYKLQRFARGGFIRLAFDTKAPIIPAAVVGAEESYPVIHNMQWLTRRTGFVMPPITPTFPFLGLLGLLPLPSKWAISFGKPIDVHQSDIKSTQDDISINRMKEQVRTSVQWLILDLLESRTSVWTG